jgi:hypothetical protein
MKERNDEKEWKRQIIHSSPEVRKKNLYYILSEIKVDEEFLWKHADWIDESTEMEKSRKRRFIQEKINSIESRGGKTNYYDMQEMYGRVSNLWSMITQSQKLPEAFMEKYLEKFSTNDWRSICQFQKLSEEFMRKYLEKIDWYTVSIYQKFSEEFYFDFYEKISKHSNYSDLINSYTHENLWPNNLKHQGLILLLKMHGHLKEK